MPSQQQTEDQKRAAQAWARVSAVAGQSYEKEYRAFAQKLPSYILTNGLGQTLAFLRAKSKGDSQKKGNDSRAYEALYRDLSRWVMKQMTGESNDRLLNWLMEGDSNSYRRASTETLAFLSWLKRFAEAELKKEK